MKTLTSNHDLLAFSQAYQKASGLPVPIAYLEQSKVYAFYSRGTMVGGFVIGQASPLRTLEVFVKDDKQENLCQELNDLQNYCEVCCFWISHSYRKHLLTNIKCWLKMAYAVKYQNKPFVLFGTNNKGLAYIYGYPFKSLLLHEDEINNRNTYVFLARKKDFAGGVWEIIWAKLLGKDRVKALELKHSLRQELTTEINHSILNSTI